uniref:Uncharacterized protein n=1 Tax=Chrysotila carterae TaxID=13221 RepID=A0A7S4F9K5_CHRCT
MTASTAHSWGMPATLIYTCCTILSVTVNATASPLLVFPVHRDVETSAVDGKLVPCNGEGTPLAEMPSGFKHRVWSKVWSPAGVGFCLGVWLGDSIVPRLTEALYKDTAVRTAEAWRQKMLTIQSIPWYVRYPKILAIAIVTSSLTEYVHALSEHGVLGSVHQTHVGRLGSHAVSSTVAVSKLQFERASCAAERVASSIAARSKGTKPVVQRLTKSEQRRVATPHASRILVADARLRPARLPHF